MDNDGKLLELARNLVKSVRFGWKYRGVTVLPAAEGNRLAGEALRRGEPFCFGRCGATEMRTVAEYLQNGGRNFSDRIRREIRDLSGVFPTDDHGAAQDRAVGTQRLRPPLHPKCVF